MPSPGQSNACDCGLDVFSTPHRRLAGKILAKIKRRLLFVRPAGPAKSGSSAVEERVGPMSVARAAISETPARQKRLLQCGNRLVVAPASPPPTRTSSLAGPSHKSRAISICAAPVGVRSMTTWRLQAFGRRHPDIGGPGPVRRPSRSSAVAAIALPLGTLASCRSLLRAINCSWSSAV